MNFIVVDSHCDSLSESYEKKIGLINKEFMFNFNDVQSKLPYIQFLATFINTKYIENNPENGYNLGIKILEEFEKQYSKYKEKYNIIKITNRNELNCCIKEEKLGIILSTENGAIIGNNVENIKSLYNKGVRVMGITWNDDNLLACGANTINDTGITNFGKEAIKKLNEFNILVDVSHLSEKSFYEAINISNNVIATHSNSYKLCPCDRNLKDDQIKEIGKKDGIIGICLYKNFLTKNEESNIEDVVNHIEYMANLIGIDHIGIGTDFDGINKKDLPLGIKNARDISKIYDEMQKRGFKKQEIIKVMGENHIRILRKNLY